MPTWIKTVKEDWRVFRLVHPGNPCLNFFYLPSFKIVFVFRLSQLLFKYKLLKPFSYFLTIFNDTLHGVWIGPSVKVGVGFFLGHPRGLVINPDTNIGSYVSIIQQVTIGGPRVIIGDYTSINAGAKIINDPFKNKTLTIGSNCTIAAAAVVLKDMPVNSVVAGMPANVVKTTDERTWVDKLSEKHNFI